MQKSISIQTNKFNFESYVVKNIYIVITNSKHFLNKKFIKTSYL